MIVAAACGVFFPAAAAAQSYQLVTTPEQLESGKRYLIVAKKSQTEYYAWNGLDTEANYGKATTVSAPSGDIITPTEDVVPVILEYNFFYFKIFDTATNKYVGVSSSSDLVGEDSAESDGFLWDIAFYEGKLWVDNNYFPDCLRFNYNGGFPMFRTYGDSENYDISLYKEITGPSMKLYNSSDNTAAITAAAEAGDTYDVTLPDRTLFKDGAWNTLCLPFSLNAEQLAASPLADADIRTLSSASFSESTLTLTFTEISPSGEQGGLIQAGTPYIIKWEKTADYDQASEDTRDIKNPTFNGVIIEDAVHDIVCDLGEGRSITFCGNYAPVVITSDGGDNTKLFLGSGNNLFFPNAAYTIGCQRAHFQLTGLTVGTPTSPVKSCFMDLGDTATGAPAITIHPRRDVANPHWFTLDGRRVNSPSRSSFYIHNARKVVIK